MQKIIIGLILGYKKIVSPVLGTNCRFYPSCSSYAIEAINKHGSLKGAWLSVKRIARCNPFGGHGLDFVPEKKSNNLVSLNVEICIPSKELTSRLSNNYYCQHKHNHIASADNHCCK